MKRCDKGLKAAGNIHSLESFGTYEGPGIRYLVFLQGCLARCLYCQNPDTWVLRGGKVMTAAVVYERIKKCLPYIKASGGGVTATGGEPLLQIGFLIELFKLCKNDSVHTAIDTSGFYHNKETIGRLETLIRLTDLFIVDIKAADRALHKKITSRGLEESLNFISILETKKKRYWIRYVLVPGLNNSKRDIYKFKELLSGLKHCEKVEFLPYHVLGRHKWKKLGFRYPISRVPIATEKDIRAAQEILKG